MKKFIVILAILLFSGAVYAQAPTQSPLTKEQIEIALKNTIAEKEYLAAKVRLVELQVQEQNLRQALDNMKAKPAEPAKKEDKKK